MTIGVRNVKEVLALLFTIMLLIVKEIKKDGFQISDLLSFLGSEEFKTALTPAIEDLKEIPAEIKDIDLNEGLELGSYAIKESFIIVRALIEKPA